MLQTRKAILKVKMQQEIKWDSRETSKVRNNNKKNIYYFVMFCYVRWWNAEESCFMGTAEGFDVSAAASLLKRDEMHKPSIK